MKQHLKQLLDSNIIRKSKSPWTSNIVLVRKKDKSLRLCVDFRQLNKRTINDAYALPCIEEILEGLGGNSYFSVLDMKSGYHQVEIQEEHKPYTAFTAGAIGFYEYNRLPFGLSNSPATYQRLMEECLEELISSDVKICQIYLDDVIVASQSAEEHFDHLERVFSKFRLAGLKLSPKKCHLFRDRVKYVGHVVSVKGVETDPDKIKKVADWPVPTNTAELRTFLGFSGYYRRFVKNFVQITKPLTHLLTGDPKYQKNKKFRSTKKTVAVEWIWGDAEQDAFDAIKGCLISSPILAYPVYNQPFILHTDASGKGLGAVLHQNIDGVERVISYASRQLNKAESHYPAHKLEFLALKWAVTQKFHDYLYGCEFVVYTDNNPLTYVMGKAKLDAVGHRWVAALNAYNFTIHYRPGRVNGDADGLSCRPDDTEYQELSKETISALCQSHTGLPNVTSLSLAAGLPDDMDLNMEVVPRKWRPLQVQDDVIGQFHRAVANKRKPDITAIKSADGLTLLREYAKLTMRRGVLYRQIQIQG